VLVFARYLSREVLPWETAIGALVLAAALAWVSYRCVELPVRRRAMLPVNRPFVATMIAGFALIALAGGAIDRSNGAPYRLTPAVRDVYQRATALPAFSCSNSPVPAIAHLCGEFSEEAAPGAVVWGDSHAGMLMPALVRAFKRAGSPWAFYQCPPVVGVYRVDEASSIDDASCTASNERMLEYLERRAVRNVLLVSYWSQYVEGIETRMEGVGTRDPFYADGSMPSDSVEDARTVFDRHFRETVASLRRTGVTVWVMQQVPSFKYWVPNEAAKVLRFGGDLRSLTRPYADYRHRTESTNRLFRELGVRGDLKMIDPTALLCANQVCRATSDGRVLYRDSNHLSEDGVQFVASVFDPLIAAVR
jgi:hypothetical protein